MYPRMASADILGWRGECIVAICRESKVTTTERVDEVRALERSGGLFRRVGIQEGAARKQANGLRYGGLEQATEMRVCAAVGGQSLAKGEESRQPSAVVSAFVISSRSNAAYLFVKHRS